MQPKLKLYQTVALKIEQGIKDGAYPAGTRLPPERDLADMFAVSRPTVREAIIALEIRNLVEVKHGSGVYVVASPPIEQPASELDVGAFELIEARFLFEGEATALSAHTLTAEEIDRLGAILRSMEAADPASDEELALDRQFHLTIAQGARNSLIEQVIEHLWDIRESSPLCRHMFNQARRSGINPRPDEHRRILNALAERDGERARQAMRDHLRRVSEDLLVVTELEMIERAKKEIRDKRQRLAGGARTGP